MTKIYKSLKAENTPKAIKQFEEARKLFQKFRNNWENWTGQFIKKDVDGEESIWARQVREKGWRVTIDISDLFPTVYSEKNPAGDPAPWDLERGYRKGDTRKNKILVYQKSFRKAFEAVDELIKYRFKAVVPDIKDKMNIAGVNLIVITDKNTGKWSRKNLDLFINILPKAVQEIKKAGFNKPLKGLTVKLVLTDIPSDQTGGEYLPSSNTVAIYKWGLADKKAALRTLIHELGHKYWWTFLNKRAKEAWGNAIWNSFIIIKDKHIDEYFNLYIHNKIEPNDEGQYRLEKSDKNKILSTIKKNENDPNRKAIYDYITYNFPFRATISKTKSELTDERIHIEFISDYARKNTEEAFCEVFAKYVIERGKLGEWTKAFFKEIARSGGADLKEDLIIKYLGVII